MQSVTLCDYLGRDLEIHTRAELSDGALRVSGQDLGSKVMKFWGKNEYEYERNLSAEDTKRLYNDLAKASDSAKSLLELVCDSFSGIDGFQKFCKFCKKQHIGGAFCSL